MGLGSEIRGPGSGKTVFRIPDLGPGVKKAPDPRFGFATLLNRIKFSLYLQYRILLNLRLLRSSQ
jgi:hypothetical protein